jgi:hypothetical protein
VNEEAAMSYGLQCHRVQVGQSESIECYTALQKLRLLLEIQGWAETRTRNTFKYTRIAESQAAS